MQDYNKVILMGRLVRDPEYREFDGGGVTNITLAVNTKRNIEQSTCFVNVDLWGKTANTAVKYLEKGRTVLIEGELKLNKWEQDGKTKSMLKVNGNRMYFIGSNKNNKDNQETQQKPKQNKQEQLDFDNDLPF